jgi:hypothetical protein
VGACPWLQRKDWSEGRVVSNTRASMRSAWVFTCLWNAVSAPLIVIVPRELARKPIAAIGFLFPIVGLGLLVWAILITLRWRRFGPTYFEMKPLPAAPGGLLQGVIATKLDRSRDSGALTVDESAGVFWSLDADADLPGVDLSEAFDVPVYRHAVAATSEAIAGPIFAPQPSEPITPERLARAGIVVRTTPAGAEYHFAAARNPQFAIGVTAFTLLWSACLGLQWYLSLPWIFIIVTALFDLLMLFIVLDLWFGSTTVLVSAGTVRRRGGFLGAGGWQTIAAAEIASLSPTISMQTSGRAGTPYYEIRVVLKNGGRSALGDGIRNKRHAEWLARRMAEEAGVVNAGAIQARR